MKYKVGEIIRSNFTGFVSIGPNSDIDEPVNEGEYFIVLNYGEYQQDLETKVGWTLLSQKYNTTSLWDETMCPLNEYFIKEKNE